MKTFICTHCLKTLDISIACKDKNQLKGYANRCKPCKNKKDADYYSVNKEDIQQKRKKYETKEYKHFMYLKHKQKRLESRRKYYKENKSTINEKRKPKNRIYEKKRRLVDPLFKLSSNLRRRLRYALSVTSYTKNKILTQYLGCSVEELKQHLQSKFTEGMTWDNYGEWHIDHIIPLCSAKTEQELYELCHYTNLQPLWAKDNQRKGGKLLPPS